MATKDMKPCADRIGAMAAEHFFNSLPDIESSSRYNASDFQHDFFDGKNLLLRTTVARLAQLLEGCPDAYKDVKVYTTIKSRDDDRLEHYTITYVCADGKLWSLSLHVLYDNEILLVKDPDCPEYAAYYYKRFEMWKRPYDTVQ